ncbi:unnamed protein product [Soboliphyme baturini]|uniref:Neur_chan_LBD domain-containing protein n=1 Tax=Soboliphyme baturini TaxID=241478 RepID=A0A183ISG9_9BILA|nr:unnamed protein product [Soboliphyme baturini]
MMFTCTFLLISLPVVRPDASEKQLLRDLFRTYYRLERPVAETSEAVIVTLSVRLRQIVDVKWKDRNMKWTPSEYGGIRDISIPAEKIWKPDILLYNNVDQKFDSANAVNAVINFEGEVTWVSPGIFRSSCAMDMTLFPFDEQTCKLKVSSTVDYTDDADVIFQFGSWTHNAWKINLQADPVGLDASEFLENGEWILLLDRDVKRDEKFYECCPQPYPTLEFYVHIKRKTLYYGFNIIIPTTIILILMVIAFILPPEEGEKMSLSMTDLLSISFLFGILNETVPPMPDNLPILGVFYSLCQAILCMSVMFNVFVLNIYRRNPKMQRMPKVVRLLLLTWIPWALIMERPKYAFCIRRCGKRHVFPSVLTRIVQKCVSNDGAYLQEKTNLVTKQLLSTDRNQINLIEPISKDILMDKLKIILLNLSFLNKLITDSEEVNEALSDWFFAARAMDRLCLAIFIVNILVSMYVLTSSTFYI